MVNAFDAVKRYGDWVQRVEVGASREGQLDAQRPGEFWEPAVWRRDDQKNTPVCHEPVEA